MTLHTPTFIQETVGDAADTVYSALEMRNLLRILLGKDTGFQGEQGVFGGTPALGFSVAQHGTYLGGGPGFSVDINVGRAVIIDDDVTNGGPYAVWMDAAYNLATPAAPGSGADLHRVILQVRNKLENGSWTTYDFIPVLVADTSGTSTLPAEPPSAITLASVAIASGQASVLNTNITDYREQIGAPAAYKAANTSRTSTTGLSNDPDLQFNNLASNAIYEFYGNVFYNGGGSFTNIADLKYTWSSTNCTAILNDTHFNLSSNTTTPNEIDTTSGGGPYTAGTNGTGNTLALTVAGTIDTANAPASLIFRWAQNTSYGTATTVMAGSFLRARRIM